MAGVARTANSAHASNRTRVPRSERLMCLLQQGPPGCPGLSPAFALAYLVAATALALLVHFGGIWNVLANTRLLDVLGRGGIIALTDADAGIIQGIPNPEYSLLASQPIDWELLLVAAGLF